MINPLVIGKNDNLIYEKYKNTPILQTRFFIVPSNKIIQKTINGKTNEYKSDLAEGIYYLLNTPGAPLKAEGEILNKIIKFINAIFDEYAPKNKKNLYKKNIYETTTCNMFTDYIEQFKTSISDKTIKLNSSIELFNFIDVPIKEGELEKITKKELSNIINKPIQEEKKEEIEELEEIEEIEEITKNELSYVPVIGKNDNLIYKTKNTKDPLTRFFIIPSNKITRKTINKETNVYKSNLAEGIYYLEPTSNSAIKAEGEILNDIIKFIQYIFDKYAKNNNIVIDEKRILETIIYNRFSNYIKRFKASIEEEPIELNSYMKLFNLIDIPVKEGKLEKIIKKGLFYVPKFPKRTTRLIQKNKQKYIVSNRLKEDGFYLYENKNGKMIATPTNKINDKTKQPIFKNLNKTKINTDFYTLLPQIPNEFLSKPTIFQSTAASIGF